MSRNIKRVAHDLAPLSKAVSELSSIISHLLNAVKSHTQFDDPKAKQYFDGCLEATEKLAISAKLITGYVEAVNDE